MKKDAAGLTIGNSPRYIRLEKSVLKIDAVNRSVFYGRRRRRHRRLLAGHQ